MAVDAYPAIVQPPPPSSEIQLGANTQSISSQSVKPFNQHLTQPYVFLWDKIKVLATIDGSCPSLNIFVNYQHSRYPEEYKKVRALFRFISSKLRDLAD